MGESTAISWTDHTFNPWWGCERVSPGCQHCYAETFAKRTGHDVWGKTSDRRFFGPKHWDEPLKWDRAAAEAGRPALVFCASMADVFEDRPDLVQPREDLFELIERTPNLIWQLLTKRPQNVRPMTRFRWFHGLPANVWVGTTVEDQQRADERLPYLLDIPARVRFLSCEPLLGDVWLPPRALGCDHDGHDEIADNLWRCEGCGQVVRYVDDPDGPITLDDLATRTRRRIREEWVRGGRTIDWVIVGGESGPGHRPLDLDHARSLVEQCERADVPVFFKQHGGRTPAAGGDLLDGERIKQFPRVRGGIVSDLDDLRLPDDCDPARWPFCESRARAAAAWAAFPEPPKITARRRTSGMSQVVRAEERRARQRAEEARTA